MRTEIVPGITVDPDVAFGKPVIEGTRVSASLVLGHLASGVTEDELEAEYDLSKEQVRAALRYAAWLADQEVVRVRTG